MKDLQETGTIMLSSNHKDRLKAEYWQTKIRYEKLKKITTNYEAASYTLVDADFKIVMPCSPELLRRQQAAMGEYLHILEMRAVVEGIELDE